MEKGTNMRKTTLMFNSLLDNPGTSQIRITIDRSSPSRKLFKKINNWEAEEHNKSVFYDSKTTFCSSLDIHKKRDFKQFINIFKIMSLVIIWAISSYSLMANNEKVQHTHQISIPKAGIRSYLITKKPRNDLIRVSLEGALLPSYYGNLSTEWMSVWVQLMVMKEVPTTTSKIRNSDILLLLNVSEVWYVPLVTEQLIGHVPEVEYDRIFHLSSHKIDNVSYHLLRLQFCTNLKTNFPVSMGYNVQPIDPEDGIIYAAFVLLGLYILIIFDIIHRTLAGMLASTMSLAILAALNERPTMSEIISWIDMETLILLFSMMVLVAIFSDTGIFDYAAVFAYKRTGGKLWPLINMLCILTTVLACFLDNVTTALLLTPITIKLCEVMNLNPKLILMYTLVFANIGGALTPIGDPPNVVIASNPDVIESGINFGVFTMHMSIGVFLALTVVYIQIRIIYKDMKYYQYDEPPQVEDLKREIAVWERTAASVSSYSKDEETVKYSLLKKTFELKDNLKQTVNNTNNTEENYKMNVKDLEKKYPIRNRSLLIKSGVTLFLVICVFFLHSIPALSRLGLGWTALLGALLLFLLYDTQDLEGVFARVEWSTLLFFASLFILMEALSRLGLIDWIGKQTQYVITSVGPESRLATAIVLILWVSAFASAFVDNLPLTTMMIRIAVNLASNSELHLPLQPLIWALSFGACLGGNGTLFGSSSNIVCAGLAEQHGHRFTFMQFMKFNDIAICGAVLISPNIALSAAHCFEDGGTYSVKAGSSNVETGGQIVYIKQVLIHPGHDKHNGDNDIAILKLRTPFRLSEKIRPVKLPKENAVIPPGTRGQVSGWGSRSITLNTISENLRAVALPVLPRSTCENSYNFIKFSKKMFCAGYKQGGKDSCNGDSGGPYVVNDTLYGLVAFGISCADSQYPGAYTSIPAHRGYIRDNCGI